MTKYLLKKQKNKKKYCDEKSEMKNHHLDERSSLWWNTFLRWKILFMISEEKIWVWINFDLESAVLGFHLVLIEIYVSQTQSKLNWNRK